MAAIAVLPHPQLKILHIHLAEHNGHQAYKVLKYCSVGLVLYASIIVIEYLYSYSNKFPREKIYLLLFTFSF